jgi:hypothetical protein
MAAMPQGACVVTHVYVLHCKHAPSAQQRSVVVVVVKHVNRSFKLRNVRRGESDSNPSTLILFCEQVERLFNLGKAMVVDSQLDKALIAFEKVCACVFVLRVYTMRVRACFMH